MNSGQSVQPSGLSSLPPEILFVILSHLVAQKNPVPGRSCVDLIRTTLSSSYIRQVALAYPSLWTHIEITDSPASFDLAKAFLNRSGSQKLEVTIRIAIRVGPKLPGVLALLKHVAGRTRELRLQIGLSKATQWEKMNDFLDALELPIVEHLALDLWDPWEAMSPTRCIPVPKGLGELRSLSLAHVRPSVHVPLLAISQLQHMSLRSSAFDEWPIFYLFSILAQAERLETLELVGEATADFVRANFLPKNEQALATPRLRRAFFSGLDSTLLAHLLFGLKAPNLEEVSVIPLGFQDFNAWSDNAHYRDPWAWVVAMHSIPSVSTLEVSFLQLTSPYFVPGAPLAQLLRETFPNTEHLSLSRHSAGVLLPFWMNMWENGKALPYASCWPFLRRLTVSGSDEDCECNCINMLKICRSFLIMRANKGLPALEDVSIKLCFRAKEDPQFEPCMDDVLRLLKTAAPLLCNCLPARQPLFSEPAILPYRT